MSNITNLIRIESNTIQTIYNIEKLVQEDHVDPEELKDYWEKELKNCPTRQFYIRCKFMKGDTAPKPLTDLVLKTFTDTYSTIIEKKPLILCHIEYANLREFESFMGIYKIASCAQLIDYTMAKLKSGMVS